MKFVPVEPEFAILQRPPQVFRQAHVGAGNIMVASCGPSYTRMLRPGMPAISFDARLPRLPQPRRNRGHLILVEGHSAFLLLSERDAGNLVNFSKPYYKAVHVSMITAIPFARHFYTYLPQRSLGIRELCIPAKLLAHVLSIDCSILLA